MTCEIDKPPVLWNDGNRAADPQHSPEDGGGALFANCKSRAHDSHPANQQLFASSANRAVTRTLEWSSRATAAFTKVRFAGTVNAR